MVEYIAVDTETTGFDTEKDKPFCISACDTQGHTYFRRWTPGHADPYQNHLWFKTLIAGKIVVFHNAKYDLKMLENEGFPLPEKWEDTMLMSYLCGETRPAHSMAYLVDYFLGGAKIEDPAWKEWIRTNQKDIAENGYLNAPKELLERYARDDAMNTIKLFYVFRGQIRVQNLEKIYAQEKEFLLCLITLERQGLQVDVQTAINTAQKLTGLVEGMKEVFLEQYELENPNSWQQVLVAFNKLGLVLPSTGKEILKGYPNQPLATQLLFYRAARTLLNTFILKVLNGTDPETHRIHTDFNQCVTGTGRLSSSGNANFQNMPKRADDPRLAGLGRAIFIPSYGTYFIGADYDQQEIRIIAEESRDPGLLQLLSRGGDIYLQIASSIWPHTEITSEQRYIAKQTTLGTAYWMGAARGVEQAAKFGVTISFGRMRDLIDMFGERFPLIIERRVQLHDEIIKYGFVTDQFGKRYHVPKTLAYKAFNNYVQGTAANMLKRSIIEYSNKYTFGMRMVNTVHDELLFEVDKKIPPDQALEVIQNCMVGWCPEVFPNVKMGASPIYYGDNWADVRKEPKEYVLLRS